MLGDQPSHTNQDPQQQAERVVAKIPKLFRARRIPLGYLLVVVQNGSLKSSPKGIDPKLTCTVKVEGGAGDTEPMPASKQEWNTEFQFPISEYTADVEVSLNTSRVDLVTQETRWIKEASASFPVSVSERKPWKESKTEQLQLSKGGKKKPNGTVNLSLRYVPRKNRWLPLEECILNPSAHLAKALLVLDTGLVSQQEYARSLLTLFWFNGRERELINMAVNHEIFTVFEKLDDITQLLRGPTLSSMILSEYMHIACEPYLAEVLAPIIRPLAQSPPQFELDPTKVDSPTPDKDLKRNQKTMTSLVNKVLKKLISTANKMPPDMGYLCRLLKDAVTTRFPENQNAWTLAMGALIFLRFICPALVSPKEFGLIPNDCAPAGTRCLILVSKVLTNLVNDVEFGSKEPYMVCMNEFLVKYKAKPMEFYNNILKRKDGFLLENKVAQRAVDEDTYRKLWKVVDTAGDSLCNTLAETVPELKQIVSQIREADRIEKEEKEAREAAEAKRLQRKEKKKTKTTEKDADKNDTGEAPATPKDPRKKVDETKKKEDTPTPKLIRKNSESVESSPLLSSSEKEAGGSGDSTPREQSNTDSEESAKSPKGKKKKLKKKTEKEEATPNAMKESKEHNTVSSEGN